MQTITPLHEQRLAAVIGVLEAGGVSSVLDLGCGPGFLLEKLAGAGRYTRLAGTDICDQVLNLAQTRLARGRDKIPDHIRLFQGSFMREDPRFAGYDAAILLETIEHIEPDQLSRLENTVFGKARPGLVIITTPNRDYNPMLGVPEQRMRHPDHRFEWGLQKFRSWSRGVGLRNDYTVSFRHIGGAHPHYGGPTQMAVMQKKTANAFF